jgi:RNase H-fold protein (predicted Holliday junction resolvase)
MNPEKIKDSLVRLGYKLADRGPYWQTNALFRNGDNKTAIQIYKNTGVWKDHVQNSSFSPFKRLVEITLGTNDKTQLKQFLEEDDLGSNYNKLTLSEKLEMEEIYPQDCLDRLLPHYKFYNDRGISTETLKPLKGGYATAGKLNNRFIFPIYNEYGQIHGFSGRDMSNSEGRPKWKHVGRKKGWIYPLYASEEVKDAINDKGEVIFVESIGDLLNLNQHGYKNVLVTFGLDISTKLICATLSLNVSRLVISLNNDKNSQRNRGLESSIKNYLKLLNYYDPEKILICLPTQKDFGDMSDNDFNSWNNKLQSTNHKKQRKFILDKINEIYKTLPKTLLKNKKIITNE